MKVHMPAFETWYGIRESSPFILKYLFLLISAKNGGQREEQLSTSENSLSSFSFPFRNRGLAIARIVTKNFVMTNSMLEVICLRIPLM